MLILLLIVQPEAFVGVVATTVVKKQELAGDGLVLGDCDNAAAIMTDEQRQQCVQKVVVTTPPPPYDEDEDDDDYNDYNDYNDFGYFYDYGVDGVDDDYYGGDDDDYYWDDDDYNGEEDEEIIVTDLYIPPIQPGELQILEFMNMNMNNHPTTPNNDNNNNNNNPNTAVNTNTNTNTPNNTPNNNINNTNNNFIIQEYIARVGLPLHFVPTMTKYIEDIGLMDLILHTMLGDDGTSSNQLEPDDDMKFHEFHIKNMSSATATTKEIENNNITLTWDIYRPGSDWNSDMHWFSVADEMAYEHIIRALGHAGLDDVFDSIGRHYNLSSLDIDGIGFVAVTHCEEGKIHTDFDDGYGKGFNLLIGISSPDNSGPEFLVQNDTHRGEIHYKPEYGLLVGDGAYHGTNNCDYRAGRRIEDSIRISISIYLGEMTDDNGEDLSDDSTGSFPSTLAYEHMISQGGRHWSADNHGTILNGDYGRSKFTHLLTEKKTIIIVENDNDDNDDDDRVKVTVKRTNCSKLKEQGKCISNENTREQCPITCNIFIDDTIYQPAGGADGADGADGKRMDRKLLFGF